MRIRIGNEPSLRGYRWIVARKGLEAFHVKHIPVVLAHSAARAPISIAGKAETIIIGGIPEIKRSGDIWASVMEYVPPHADSFCRTAAVCRHNVCIRTSDTESVVVHINISWCVVDVQGTPRIGIWFCQYHLIVGKPYAVRNSTHACITEIHTSGIGGAGIVDTVTDDWSPIDHPIQVYRLITSLRAWPAYSVALDNGSVLIQYINAFGVATVYRIAFHHKSFLFGESDITGASQIKTDVSSL